MSDFMYLFRGGGDPEASPENAGAYEKVDGLDRPLTAAEPVCFGRTTSGGGKIVSGAKIMPDSPIAEGRKWSAASSSSRPKTLDQADWDVEGLSDFSEDRWQRWKCASFSHESLIGMSDAANVHSLVDHLSKCESGKIDGRLKPLSFGLGNFELVEDVVPRPLRYSGAGGPGKSGVPEDPRHGCIASRETRRWT